MPTTRERLLEVARSQLGVRYWSMHTGPRGSGSEGWGCAMFCAWCYRQVLGTDYYGSCWNFAGDALGQSVNQGGGEWRFIGADEALPGDCVLYCASGHTGTDYDDYGHIAMYVGDGRVIGAMGRGVPGAADYLNIGIKETNTAGQSIGGIMRFIRCTRLDGASEEDYPMAQTVTCTRALYVRTSPSTKSMSNVCKSNGRYVRYAKGDTFAIEGVTFADGRVWGYYTGATSHERRYVSLGTTNNATVG